MTETMRGDLLNVPKKPDLTLKNDISAVVLSQDMFILSDIYMIVTLGRYQMNNRKRIALLR